ncbi:MAG TPA: shikimate dehydrogenase [Firmicutes bacterium]|nr:shikimate dehydrogenase [Bacillota bacterium]
MIEEEKYIKISEEWSRMHMITGETRITGIFGFPVEHSLSPAMHNAAYREMGLNYCYVPFSVTKEHLSAAVNSIKALNLAGVNVTSPHKEGVLKHLDKIAPEASFLEAVNTIVNEAGILTGYNTDYLGYVEGIRKDAAAPEIKGGRITILGGGGAARAVAYGLAAAGAGEILFIVRNPGKLAYWLDKFKKRFPETEVAACSFEEKKEIGCHLKKTTILTNALPVSLVDSRGKWLVDFSSLNKGAFISDLRYAADAAELVEWGKAAGYRVQNGLPMLLEQGILSFELFTGKTPPREVMEEALKNRI